jgi:mono/diheme cytochrome c family protein
MDSNLLIRIHSISVMLFLLTYLIKTILLFSNRTALDKYAKVTKVPEMIISFAFLVTGIWLFVIIGGIKTAQIFKLACVIVSIPIAIIGFKKYKKGLALFSFILIVAAYGLAEMSRNKPFIASKTEINYDNANADFNKGAMVYHANCVFCHGNDGKKMYHGAPDLTKSVTTEDGIVQMVKEGSKGKMPAYNLVLSNDDISAVAKFVTGIRPPAVNSNDTTRIVE